MAKPLTTEQLRSCFQQPTGLSEEPFDILRAIGDLLCAEEDVIAAREMVLRALERRTDFGQASEILDALARQAGYFPYADRDALDFRDRLAYECHRPLAMSDDFVFHREQADVYHRLLAGDNVILSAPTSFGKSRIIDAIIATGQHENIAVVVPMLALIDETRRRLSAFSNAYKIVTHVTQPPADRNIFVFTAERAVAYDNLPPIRFFAIDEFYKIGAMAEDESRTIALNQAFYRLWKDKGQFYLLGPNIHAIPNGLEQAYQCHFYRTDFSTVVVEVHKPKKKKKTIADLIALVKTLSDPTLLFCSSPPKANKVAAELIAAGIAVGVPSMKDATHWIGATFHPDWVFGKALEKGIGIHHGRLPRSLAQFVVRAFNDDKIQFLICTSTLIEGVNTKAKNVVIWDNKIANRTIDHFTFNNIKGRSGRMFKHFVGNVYLFDDPPQEELPFVDFPFFTQDEHTPAALLVQMDQEDLTDQSQERIEKYGDQHSLSLSVIKQNSSIDPDQQIALAEYIAANAARLWPQFAWNAFPTYDQLNFVCGILWQYFVGEPHQNVVSAKQLALRTWRFWHELNTAVRIREELKPGQYAAKSPDEAVERVLQFERNWMGFELPRFLMAVSRIQEEVLGKAGLPAGDYSLFAAQVESLFRPPVLTALDEYGIPMQVGEKIQAYLKTKDDLDLAIANLRLFDVSKLRLAPFERELLADAIKGLG